MPIITSAGAVPTSPDDLNAELLAGAVARAPGLTATLPGSLIEDMSSTATGALIVQDQAAVDLINSISPLTANEFILEQLGLVYGVRPGLGSNTSVFVTFHGSPGFVVNIGFIVSDGTHQYIVQDPAIISAPGPSGSSQPTFCVAVDPGTWAVPPGTVTQLITSVPEGFTLTCTNDSTGVPGGDPQTIGQYQAQVIQAGQAISTGVSTLVKTALQNVPGVQARLIAFRQTGGGWQVIVGGGDPYQVANAIFQSMFNILDLVGAATVGATETIAINDFPDTYSIVYVVPAQATVGIVCTWETVASANFVSPAIVTALAQPALVDYINSIAVGQPISVLQLQDTFINAVKDSIPESAISVLTFIVTINSTIVNPPAGGVLISGDPEAFFFTASANVAIVQG